jgi:hypothetical protein
MGKVGRVGRDGAGGGEGVRKGGGEGDHGGRSDCSDNSVPKWNNEISTVILHSIQSNYVSTVVSVVVNSNWQKQPTPQSVDVSISRSTMNFHLLGYLIQILLCPTCLDDSLDAFAGSLL